MGKNFKKFLKLLRINESTVSIILGALVVVVVGVLVFNYFSRLNRGRSVQTPPKEEVSPTEEKPTSTPPPAGAKLELPTRYTVVAGDNLWKIAEKYYKSGYNWVDIASFNNLTDPDTLNEGMVLNIPKVEVRKGDINGPGITTAGATAITTPTYTVARGDNLWNIAVRACGDGYKWVKLAEENKLAYPNTIHSGNVFKIKCK